MPVRLSEMIAVNCGPRQCDRAKTTANFLVSSPAFPVSGNPAVLLTHDALISDPCLDSYQMQGLASHLYKQLFLKPSQQQYFPGNCAVNPYPIQDRSWSTLLALQGSYIVLWTQSKACSLLTRIN
jgi:hypothetical protein